MWVLVLCLALHFTPAKPCVFETGVTTLGGSDHLESERMGLPLIVTNVHLTPEGALVTSEQPLSPSQQTKSLLDLQTRGTQRVSLYTDHLYNSNFASQVLLRVSQPQAITPIIHKSFGMRSFALPVSNTLPTQKPHRGVCISSTDPQVLRNMENAYPEAITILELPSDQDTDQEVDSTELCNKAAKQQFDGFALPFAKMNDEAVECARAHQLKIGVTGANTAYDLHQLIYKYGVDFVVTDHPALYKRAANKQYPQQGVTHIAFLGS